MPRISEARKAEQRRRIVDALLDAMREKGIAETAMSDVIERSGLSAGAIYGYFASKDDILVEAAREVVSDRVEIFGTFLDGGSIPSPAEVVEHLVTDLPAFVEDKRVLLQVWGIATTKPEIATLGRESIAALQRGARDYLEGWYRQEGVATPAARARRAAPSFLSLAQGYMIQAAVGADIDPSSYRASIEALLG